LFSIREVSFIANGERVVQKRRDSMTRQWAIFLLALAPWFAAGAPTNSPTVINVGVCVQEPFLQIRGKGDVIEGVFPDILNYVAAQKGWTIHYIPDTPANNMARLDRGALDLLIPVPWSNEKSRRYEFTREGLVTSQGRLYVPAITQISSLSDLSGKLIAVVRDDPHYEMFSAMLNNMQVRCEFVEMESYTQVFESLDRRRVDAGLVDQCFGERNAARYSIALSYVASPVVEFRFAAPRVRGRTVIDALDYWQAILKADHESLYHRSMQRWARRNQSHLATIAGSILLVFALIGAGVFGLFRLHRYVVLQNARLTNTSTDLRQAAEEQERHARIAQCQKDWYYALLNSTEDIMLVHGVDGKNQASKFIEVNQAACLRLGYTREELLSLSPREIEVSSGSSARPLYFDLIKNWANHQAGGESSTAQAGSHPLQLSGECTYRTKSGAEIPAEVTVRVLGYEDRPVVFYSAHDISSRRKTLVALQESERRLQDFFARSPIGIALYDATRKLTEVNQSALGMFGVSDRNQFVHLNLMAAPHLQDDDRTTLLKGGTVRREMVLDFDQIKAARQVQSMRTGKCHFDALMTNLGLDRDFNPKGFLVMLQDITEHRRAEEALRQNERLLRQAHKMEAIGTLAGGIAHDFNNILTPIIGYTEMALLSCPPQDAMRTSLDEVLKASHRAKDLVKQILMFSRQTEHDEKPIRLIQVIKEVMALLRGSIMPNVELRCDLRTERDIVRADPTQMHQVLMNLSMNALHAMTNKGGTLEIGLGLVVLDGRAKGPLSQLRRGTYVDLSVRDTGIGMDRATLDRIFEPFFTTKRSGEGTGMGLAVVHGIIASLHGMITVESEVGKGSVFHVVLPLVEKAAEQVATPVEPIPLGTEHVMFVDDEADIVTMVEQMLKSLGYKPVTFQRSQEALSFFREHPDRFDLLITDQVMPVLSGMEMVREIHRIRPGFPVLLCTGFSKMVSDTELLEGGVSEILMKPIVLRQLAEAIRRVLSQQSQTVLPKH
jgi:PAS domain S-box-containing protein